MAARDGDPDRLTAAKAEARRLRAEIPAGGVASVVVADARPRVALTASGDRGAFDRALDPLEVTAGAADFAGAFVLAESLETTGDSIAFVFLSDGGLSDAEQALLPPGTTYHAIGDQSTNRAISRLTVEPATGGLRGFVTVSNTGGPEATQTLRLDVDGATAVTREVTVGSGESVDVEVDLPAGQRVQAFLEGEDLLDADDRAYAVAPQPAPSRRARGRSRGPAARRAAGGDPGGGGDPVGDTGARPRRRPGDLRPVDVPADPQAPFLAIAPPSGAPGRGGHRQRRAAGPDAGAHRRPAAGGRRPVGGGHPLGPATRGADGRVARGGRGHAAAGAGRRGRPALRVPGLSARPSRTCPCSTPSPCSATASWPSSEGPRCRPSRCLPARRCRSTLPATAP